MVIKNVGQRNIFIQILLRGILRKDFIIRKFKIGGQQEIEAAVVDVADLQKKFRLVIFNVPKNLGVAARIRAG